MFYYGFSIEHTGFVSTPALPESELVPTSFVPFLETNLLVPIVLADDVYNHT